MNDIYLSVSEVAKRMYVSTTVVYNLRDSGQLPMRKIGKNYRIAESDFEAYFATTIYNPKSQK
ncbi:hypothetical protein FACS1894202_07360 [Clostridia bacterium]|nr:hypothetical protein FACS1894202_07360 [Clostridia bacterium]